MSKSIELVGGPHDGERMDVFEGRTALRLPLGMTATEAVAVHQPGVERPEGLRYGTYQPLTDYDAIVGRWTWREDESAEPEGEQ